MSNNVVEVTALRKVFPVKNEAGRDDDFVAVDDVSFRLDRGESLAIVGESGSGKTTVARILVGLEKPTSGTVRIASADAIAPRRRRASSVQMVFQDPYASLDPRQRVGASIAEALNAAGDSNRNTKQQVATMLEDVGLDPVMARSYPRALSGGQRQRVAIARALAPRPGLLILDEAVAALDVSVQAQVLNLLADLREQTSLAYLFITHDLSIVPTISERVMVMQRGRVVETGTTTAVLQSPSAEYTRRLVEAVPRAGWRPRRREAAAPVT